MTRTATSPDRAAMIRLLRSLPGRGSDPLDDARVADAARDLAEFAGLLARWNKAMNLVGPRTWEEMAATLFADSFHLAAFLDGLNLPDDPVTLDLGAGAGIPGIPLRVLWGAGVYHLVEIREKRAVFLRTALSTIHLPRTLAFGGRAEEALMRYAPVDMVVSRAFMPWRKLLGFLEAQGEAGGACVFSSRGRVVVMAKEPPPHDDEMPEGWRVESASDYRVDADRRYLWSLRPKA